MVLLSSVTLVNIEKIPMSFCCSGGIVLSLNFIECPLSCKVCPWEANISRRAADVLKIGARTILETVERFSPDIVMFHGGEPYTDEDTVQLMKEINNNSSSYVGIKANIVYATSNLHLLERCLHFIDVLLIEFVDELFCKAVQSNTLEKMFETINTLLSAGKYYEIVVVFTEENCGNKLLEVLTTFGKLLKEFLTPINYVFADEVSLSFKLKAVDVFRSQGIAVQAPLEASTEIASTMCISCKNPVIVRQSGTLVKLGITGEGTCKYCGYRYWNFRPAKKVIKNPISIQLL